MALTGTVCPFPWSAPPSIVPPSASDCTISYAAALGPWFIALHVFCLLSSFFGMVALGVHLWLLRAYCISSKQAFWTHSHTMHYLLTCLFSLCWFLSSIDWFGFWGVVPIEACVLFNECASAFGFTNGVLIVRFIYKIATKKLTNQEARITSLVTRFIIFLIWMNFVGWSILGVSHTRYHFMYDAIKAFGAAMILFVIGIVSIDYGLLIQKNLLQAGSLTYAEAHAEVKEMVRVLKQKQIRLLFLASNLVILCTFRGIWSIARDDYSWVFPLEEAPDPVQVVIDLSYLGNVILCLHVFSLPRQNSTTKGSNSQPACPPQSRKPPIKKTLNISVQKPSKNNDLSRNDPNFTTIERDTSPANATPCIDPEPSTPMQSETTEQTEPRISVMETPKNLANKDANWGPLM